MLLGRLEIPARCLVPAGRALKRDAPLPEVQQRIVTVETTQELPNPVGNHCAETPFQVTARYDERLTGLVPRAPHLRPRHFKRNATRAVECLSDWSLMD